MLDRQNKKENLVGITTHCGKETFIHLIKLRKMDIIKKFKIRHKRRSTPATMYDLIDQCHEYESGMRFHDQGGENDYQDGFWKVFMLNEKPGKATRCCERSSSFNTHGYQDSKMADVATAEPCSASCYCMKHSKTARRRRFKSQSGYYLAIMPNGQIMGIKDKNSPYIDIDVIPVGADLVKVWGVESELFLMIDDQGQMRGTDVDSAECIFEETLTENFFNVYYSAMYLNKRWCIGLRNKQQTRSFLPETETCKRHFFYD